VNTYSLCVIRVFTTVGVCVCARCVCLCLLCVCAPCVCVHCWCVFVRARSERMEDAAIEDALERAVQLFSFITDKDLFGEIYRCLAVHLCVCVRASVCA